MYNKLHYIHQDLLERFECKTDKENYGVDEYWPTPDEVPGGFETYREDCDGFAAACLKECRKQGIKSRIFLCYTEIGEKHAVMESHGWILDNRQDQVIARDLLDYTWLIGSGYKLGDKWRKIKNITQAQIDFLDSLPEVV